MFEKFSPDARSVVSKSQQSARLRGAAETTTGDLLIGVVELEGGPLEEVLNVTAVCNLLGTALRTTSGHIPFSSNAKAVLHHATRAAYHDDGIDAKVEPIHLVAAILQVGCWAQRCLTEITTMTTDELATALGRPPRWVVDGGYVRRGADYVIAGTLDAHRLAAVLQAHWE